MKFKILIIFLLTIPCFAQKNVFPSDKVDEIVNTNDKVNLIKKDSNLIVNKHQLQPIINKEIELIFW